MKPETVAYKTKECINSGEHQSLSAFRACNRCGRECEPGYSECRHCQEVRRNWKSKNSARENAWHKEHYRKNSERICARVSKQKILSRYGITIEDRDRMYAAQDGKCQCCGGSLSKTEKSPQIDHCHATGKVRGLLCVGCNTFIGKLEKHPTLITQAARYLKRHE